MRTLPTPQTAGTRARTHEVEAVAGSASSGLLGRLPNEAGIAAGRGDETALLAWLESGGRVNASCKLGGETPLGAAAASGHERVVEPLLQRGAAVDQHSSDG